MAQEVTIQGFAKYFLTDSKVNGIKFDETESFSYSISKGSYQKKNDNNILYLWAKPKSEEKTILLYSTQLNPKAINEKTVLVALKSLVEMAKVHKEGGYQTESGENIEVHLT